MSRELDVFIDHLVVGRLSEQDNIWSFQYDANWLSKSDNYPLSPKIPLISKIQTDGSSTRHIQWFMDNLLPEEEARKLLAKDIKEHADDIFALLTKAGAESAGAITLLPPETPMPQGDQYQLTEAEISQRIKALPRTPMNRAEHKRMSLAGAQHKMLVIYKDGQLFEPSGQMPSTHILKPAHSSPDLYYQTPMNEWFAMKLAGQCGLNVPAVDIIYFPEPAYLVQRFDRKGAHPNQQRLHMLDGCQLLGIPPTAKYHNNNAKSLVRLIEMTRTKAKTRIEIFRWACFNAIIGNGDAHLKNLSFFIRKNFIAMTPHYDLLSTAIYEDTGKHLDHELAQEMGEARFLSDLTFSHVLTFADELGLPEKLTKMVVTTLITQIVPASMALYKYLESQPTTPSKPGELRMLREIHFNCILEMTKRIVPN